MSDIQKIQKVEREILEMKAAIRRGNALTMFAGIIVLGLLGAFFVYGYQQISEVLKPKMLVDSGMSIMTDNLPEASKTLEAEVIKNAPKWAQDTSKKIIEEIPEARKEIEKAVVKAAEEQLVKGSSLTKEEFTKFIKDNRVMLRDGFGELKKGDKEAKKFLDSLVKAMEDQLGRDFKDEADTMFHLLLEMNSRASELKDNKFVKGGNFHLKQVLSLAKRASMKAADPKMHITTPK